MNDFHLVLAGEKCEWAFVSDGGWDHNPRSGEVHLALTLDYLERECTFTMLVVRAARMSWNEVERLNVAETGATQKAMVGEAVLLAEDNTPPPPQEELATRRRRFQNVLAVSIAGGQYAKQILRSFVSHPGVAGLAIFRRGTTKWSVSLKKENPKQRDKIRIGCLTPTFSGAQRGAEMLPHPCLLGGPKEGGNVTSPLHSQRSPTASAGTKIRSGSLNPAFSGAHYPQLAVIQWHFVQPWDHGTMGLRGDAMWRIPCGERALCTGCVGEHHHGFGSWHHCHNGT